ncbi:MAG: mycolate reductase [Corynebacterium sp.]|nr:mycolate reductase [Corynebacterium sp.]
MPLPHASFSSRALVTGASQGIGQALAAQLAAQGHNLLLVARRKEVLEAFAATLEKQHRVQVDVYPCDLGDSIQRAELLQYLKTQEIHILVNSAGIASFGPFSKQDWGYESQQFAVNATAVFELTHAVLQPMLERGSGAICNVGSAAGNVPIPNNATYVFTKAGVNAFTEALHYELRGSGVSCTLLAPGPVRADEIDPTEASIVDKMVPNFLWTTYESCAQETLEAMAAGKRRVVPGPLGKVMNGVSTVLPTKVLAPVMGKFYAKLGE